ncbi:RIP metalloprotease RseP [Alkalibacillus haloalkaliphilus]|uniref:RIP metalloprotease RseP n=1 Tax=Alkalibacillus haloalkaliphilus TaxID=94136 RepID=UPI0029363DAD|nr:RIP metalloprotease RseP [Alkalibacillus haloalkaliphilus]MDV2580637.1 RIP metalloprotease RseP [Alkalibacillus haloalkaliphilus]
MNTVIAFIFMFGLLVFIHELGHLIFAKRAGMLAREFAIGFGPKIFSYRKDETLYTVRLLPIGGYVRVAGEDPEIIELKPGHHIGLEFNDFGDVNKIIVNNKSNYPNAKIVEVEQVDLDHELKIDCYELDTDEHHQYSVDRKALFVMDDKETLIAPYDRQFGSKSVGQKGIQVFAGPAMNFLLAIAIFIGLGFLQGVPVDEALIGGVQEDSPAEQAELMEGDEVVSINGQSIETWMDFVMYVQERPDEQLDVTVERDGELISKSITPESFTEQGETIGRLGVMRMFEDSPGDVILYGFTQTYDITVLIINALGQLVTGQLSLDALAGPVGIYSATDDVVQTGFLNFLMWTAMLSINLGIINLLPLPALDGGRLMFIGLEAIRGKPVDPQKEGVVHFIGFALLMLLMIVVTWNDIERLFM